MMLHNKSFLQKDVLGPIYIYAFVFCTQIFFFGVANILLLLNASFAVYEIYVYCFSVSVGDHPMD